MEHIQIHYFTGTGNTARAIRVMADRFRETGRSVSIVQIAKTAQVAIDSDALLVVAFPVLSWAPPAMVQHYLRQFPDSEQTRVALLAINGASLYKGKIVDGYTGQALEQAERILKRKGYEVFLSGNASFPDNWTQMTNPCDADTVQAILPKGDARVLEFAEKVLEGKHELFRCGVFNYIWSWLVAVSFGLIGRRVLGTFYIADERCTGCALCAKTCPAETIVMNKKTPVWKTRCEDCNRCINICPEQAIQVSMPLMIVQLSLNVLLTILFIFLALHAGALLVPESGWLHSLTDVVFVSTGIVVAAWMTLVPLRHLANRLQVIPAVRRLISHSVTKSYRRYTAPGYKPGNNTSL